MNQYQLPTDKNMSWRYTSWTMIFNGVLLLAGICIVVASAFDPTVDSDKGWQMITISLANIGLREKTQKKVIH